MARFAFLGIAWAPVLWLLIVGGGPETAGGRETVSRLPQRAIETLWVAGGASLAALLLATPLALGLGRLRIPGRRMWLLVVLMPFFIPPYIHAVAAVRMLGAQGWATRMVVPDAESLPLGPTASPGGEASARTESTESLTTASLPPALRSAPIFTRGGTIGVLAFSFFPLVVLCGLVFLGMGESNVEEWALLEASPGRVLWRVALPRAFPGLLIGTFGVFLLSMAEFGVPEALRGHPVLSVEVYIQMGVYYAPRAGALAGLALVALALGAVVLAGAALNRMRPSWREEWNEQVVAAAEEGEPFRIGRAGRWGWTLFLGATVALPVGAALGTLVHSSLETSGIAAWNTAWATGRDELFASAWLGTLAAGLCLLLAWAMTLDANTRKDTDANEDDNEDEHDGNRREPNRTPNATPRRWRRWGRRTRGVVVRGAFFMPFLMPGPVVALGWSSLLSETAAWGLGPEAAQGGWSAWAPRALGAMAAGLLEGPWALMLAWAGRWTPLAFGLLWLMRRRIPVEWEEAARLEGAGWLWRLRWIDWPAMRHALLAAGGGILCLSLGEVGAAVLLLPPGTTTLGVRLMTLMHYAPTAMVAAQSLMAAAMGLAAAGLVLGGWALWRKRAGNRPTPTKR